MTGALVHADGPVTLVGGGPVDPVQLAQALAIAPVAVGADGGGDVVLPGDRSFAAVIGDMDSLRDPDALRRCRLNGMAEDFSWERRIREYEALYRRAHGR